MNRAGLTIEDLVNRENAWYHANQEPWPVEQMALFAWTRRVAMRILGRRDQ